MAVVPTTALIPVPAKLTPRSGSFALAATTSIVAGDDLRAPAELLRDQLRPASGVPLLIAPSAEGARITLALGGALAHPGDEGDRLAGKADRERGVEGE